MNDLSTEDTEDTERDTPETDGQLVCAVGRKEIQAGLVPADFARKLERNLQDYISRYICYRETIRDLKEIFNERIDGLRKEIDVAESNFAEAIKSWEDEQ